MPVPPVIEELSPAPDVEDVFRKLAGKPHCLLLDSVQRHPHLGRYSFAAADPFRMIVVPTDATDGLGVLDAALEGMTSESRPELPPFQGGAAGLLSYELARGLEKLPQGGRDEFQLPAMAVGLYDVVLAWDHQQDRSWIISQGWPEQDPAARYARAIDRARLIRSWLSASPKAAGAGESSHVGRQLQLGELGPAFQVAGHEGLVSDFSPDGYLATVRQVVDYIHAGDVFQVNLSQRLLYPAQDSSVALYLRLRRHNPATFAAYFDLGEFQVCSSSPERFLQVRDRRVEARPIKGTRPKSALPEADIYSGNELMRSEKDRAENVMIVDLLRNDLSRVCDPHSVYVPELCGLESFAYVRHLVSVIRGRLCDDASPIDLLRAAFPGGSITGAPKIRAMEIIAELEPTVRGAYCGALGYLGFDGSMDTSILIRTVTAGRGWWQLPVGGGVVAQSSPRVEYEETWHKAAGMLHALRKN